MTSDLLSPRGVSGMYGSDFEAASDFVWFAPAPDANKYSRGKLVVVAGSSRYPGAAVLAARASQRMGAGYTEVVTAEEAVEIVRLSSPSLVVRPFSSWDVAIDSPEAREGRPCAICMGPGFVPGARRSDELALRLLKNARCPVLVDGGALTSIGTAKGVKRLQKRAKSGFPTVITPHGGEAARLASALGVDATAPDLAHALNAIVVLKGPDTYISDGDRTALMCEGTAALAKAGTGDVLAGMIAALLAQGIDPFDAAVTGATVHARAGIAAAERFTSVSVVAEDLIDAIPAALVL